jgi:RNA polymerase sigma-70 factor (ECF subfamily)
MIASSEDQLDQVLLVHRALSGDDSSWAVLMRRHQEPVYRLAYLLSGDPDEADDIAQEAFIRAYGALEQFDPERPMRPWLLRITRNTAHNRRRAIRRYLQALRRAARLEPLLTASAHSPTESSDQRSERNRLWEAVKRLSRMDQEVIYLRYYLELTEGEAAEALSVPSGTVKSRTHRALARLQTVIKDDFPDLIEGEL